MAFAFGSSAEIGRSLISQRIREAVARKKSEGIKLGRPCGSKKRNPKPAKPIGFIKAKLAEGAKQIEIARSLKVHRHTVKNWMLRNELL